MTPLYSFIFFLGQFHDRSGALQRFKRIVHVVEREFRFYYVIFVRFLRNLGPWNHGQASQHSQHVGDSSCRSRQVDTHRFARLEGRNHCRQEGGGRALHRHPEGRAGALHHHQVHVSARKSCALLCTRLWLRFCLFSF